MKFKNFYFVLLLFSVFIAFFTFSSAVSAANIGVNQTTVNSGESIYYNNISSAIQNARHGDTITIYNGIYTGIGNRNITFDKNLTIQGAQYAVKGTGETIIDTESLSRIFNIDSGLTVKFYGIKFLNKNASNYGSAIYQDKGTLEIANCTFTNSTSNMGGPVYQYTGNLTITNCTFTNNSANYYGGAIYQNKGNLTIYNCIFTNNSAINWGVLYIKIKVQ